MVIAFPPCTHLAVSGARYFEQKRKDGRQQQGIDFFMLFANCDCPKVAIENPVGIMSNVYRKPDQIIQPWQFGHGETKKTCLWLKGLSLLKPTNIVDGREARVWKMPPSAERAKLRSKTYPGIAKAMAEQWAGKSEKLNMDKNMDWIYRTVPMDPELEKTLEAVEKALGFRLFVWQKTYIERGCFRQYGATTAEILRDLLNVSEAPLDYTRKQSSRMQSVYREELRKIKEKLDAAGIPTRPVFFTKQDRERYLRENDPRERARRQQDTRNL